MTMPLLFGPYGVPASDDVSRFTDFGANAAWFHGFSPRAFEICSAGGLEACVEFATFRADLDRRPELVPVGVDGRPIRHGALVQGVCLSQQPFLDEIEERLLTGVRAYRPAGVWFDYLTYGGWFETPDPDLQDSCFCPDCIAEFCEATGIDATTPQEILGSHADQWTDHKCDRVARYAAHYAELVRSHLPGCTIGAYMCPWTPDEYGGALRRIFAQDYALLAPAIDVFAPLIYVAKSGRGAGWGAEFLDRAGDFVPAGRKVQLILDAMDFPDSLLAAAAADQPSWGLQMFAGAELFDDPAKASIFREAVTRIRSAMTH